jgi:diguanylate cyclase (GGDEF)-like protein/PAS domain S-box-containing protein
MDPTQTWPDPRSSTAPATVRSTSDRIPAVEQRDPAADRHVGVAQNRDDPPGSRDARQRRAIAGSDRPASAVNRRSAAAFAALELRMVDAEARTWRLLQAVPDPLVVTNADGVIELINAQAVLLFGYQPDELIGQSVERLIPAALHDAHRRHRAAYVAVDEPSRMSTGGHIVATRKDGSTVPVEVHLSAITLAGGRALLASVRDVSDRRRAEAERRISDERFQAAFDWAPTGMAMIDLRPASVGRFLRVNQALCRLTGYTEAALLATTSTAITHPDDRAETAANLHRLATGDSPARWVTDKRYLTTSGRDVWVHVAVAVVHDAGGAPTYGVSQVEDISDRKRAEAQLQERFQALADNVDVGFLVRQLNPPEYLYYNPAYLRIFGHDSDGPPPTPSQATESVHPDDLARVGTVLASVADGRQVDLEWRFTRLDGQPRWVSGRISPIRENDGQIHRVAGVFTDITDRKATEAALAESQYLRHTALHDGLTGLPNRALLMDRLDSALARSERTQREVTVFFCDLDGFKRVNDVAGHAAGDQVLLEITRRLRSVLREGDTVARIGGDEFVILVEPWNRKSAVNGPGDPADDRAAAIRIAERIGAAVRRPITINGVEHGVSVSVGITHVGQSPTGSSRGTTAEEILQDADMAMYRAKSGGKDRFAIFEHGMRADVAQRARVEQILRQALLPAGGSNSAGRVPEPAGPLLFAAYQPIFDAADGALMGFEALARLTDAHGGNIPPDEFIPIAEDSGLIRALGIRILDLACGQLGAWRANRPDLAALTMSVNVSALQAQHESLAGDVRVALRKHGLAPSDIVLELTETVLLGADQSTIQTLQDMHAEGIGIAIDDFGTGYASLRYLATLPISALKIDRSFTAGLPENKVCRNIINAVAGLAADLDLSCVVEGIETQAQRDALPSGVQLQGYLVGRPQRPDLVDLSSLADRGSRGG